MLSLLPALPAASKRTELVALNTSQVSFNACDSVIFQDLPSPVSSPKMPGPRSSFRCPDSPGKANRKDWMAVAGSLNTLGWPLTLNVPVLGRLPFITADEVSSQL